MIKSVLKEICIMLLLCVAIVLVLGVIFYDYIPSNKAIPNKLATYTTPENVQKEIEEEIVELNQENTVQTYTVTGTDLNLYKQTNSYKTGKPDPFSASTVTNNPVGGNTGGNNTNTNTSSGSNNTNTTKPSTDPNSTGTFYNNTGLK